MATSYLEKLTWASADTDEPEQLDRGELSLVDCARAYVALASILGDNEARRRVFERNPASDDSAALPS